MSVQLEVLEDPARACAALMVGVALGNGHIVLTGGSTPRIAYGHFAEAVRTVGMTLEGTSFWMGDERCVDPDDDRANSRMIRESLLEPLAGVTAPPRFHRMRGELGPEAGAEDYEQEIRRTFSDLPPRFDLLLLGIGPDGHCASLFPEQATLQERERMVIGVPEAGLEPYVPRVSFTLPLLWSARHVVFLATGEAKADAVARAFSPDARPDPRTPSSLVVPEAELITVLVDAAAASQLPAGKRR